ncbi:MAG: hypothetical protein ACXVEI_04615, partial [Actinomycetota bacterium]
MTRSSRAARTGSLTALAALMLIMVLPASSAAQPAGIAGHVIQATDHRPVAGQPVTLSTYRGETRLSTASTTTDALGVFSFGPPPTDATGFQLTTTFRGGIYRTPLTSIIDPNPPVTLKVFAPTTDVTAITQTNWVVWVDPMPGGIVVQQDLTWNNEGTTAYIGADAGGGVVTEVPLSPGATKVQYLGLYLNGGGRIAGNTYQGTQPIVPGRSSATVRYVVPTLNDLRLVSPLTTGNLHVFVATALVVSAPGMTSAGQIVDRGTDYQVFTAANVSAEQTITVGLTPTPKPKSDAGPFAIAGIVILLLVVTFTVWRIKGGGRRRRAGSPPRGSDTLRRPPSRRAAPGDETEVLLEEIAAIDVAFEEG